MKRSVSVSNTSKLYPFSVYCCASLVKTLQTFILQPGFVDLCESTRNIPQGTSYSDVYDCAIWRDCLSDSGDRFLSAANNFAFLLNIDWFQPFVHVTYSVGVIYLVVLNLPRSIRFKKEYVLSLGVIPGPSEPKLTVNSYLEPIVDDLIKLWKGDSFLVPPGNVTQEFRGALIGISCDLPATRKVCGFQGHTANLGCSKCLVEFSEGFNHQNYTNFNIGTWTLRTKSTHDADIKEIQKAKNKTARKNAESAKGCRYSVLLDLPYFDAVRMHLIDPMHNLYLGTPKHFMLDILIGRNILTPDKLNVIEQRLQRLKILVGTSMGRIPTKIDRSTFLTVEQWMNWTNYFSIVCLRDLIPDDQLECWRHFVLASRRLCKLSITSDDITIANALLLRFCKKMLQIYGRDSLTPNIHLHLHLAPCVKDYGPFRSYWLYPFERYNGVMGSQPNNNRSIEVQLMRRFHADILSAQLADQVRCWPFGEHFDKLLPATNSGEDSVITSEQESPTVKPGYKSVISVLSPDDIVVLQQALSPVFYEHSEWRSVHCYCMSQVYLHHLEWVQT